MSKKLPRGLRLNNPGNIEFQDKKRKFSPFEGASADQPDDRFVKFETIEDGLRAIAVTLITYQEKRKAKDGSKIDTLREIVERWAPAFENNVNAYVDHLDDYAILGEDGLWDARDSDEMRSVIEGITRHEQGITADKPLPYDEATVNRAMQRAGIKIKPKPLSQSRTMKTAAGGAAATAVVNVIVENADAITPYVPLLETVVSKAPWVIAAVAVAALAYIAYCRWDDHRRAVR